MFDVWLNSAMIFSGLPHTAGFRRLCLKGIASVQLIVMVMIAVPAFCYELTPDKGKQDICISAYAPDTHSDDNADQCPCCPDDPSGTDNCAACSGCAFYTPLVSVPFVTYAPAVVQLEAPEHFTKLYEVLIPIFVPPQNLA